MKSIVTKNGREPKQSRLIRDTEIIKTILEKHFDQQFDYEADETGTIPTAVLFVRKPKSESQNGQAGMSIRELAEHWQHDPATVRRLTKGRARKLADPLPLSYAHGQKTMVRAVTPDEWLLRQNGNPTKAKALAKAVSDSIMRDTVCGHKPKHLRGLCLACYNADLRQDIEESRERRKVAEWRRGEARSNGMVVHAGAFTLRITHTVNNGTEYRRVEYQPSSQVPSTVRGNLTYITGLVTKVLDHQFDRAFDIVVTIEDEMTILTSRIGDREQNWMTVGDVAARLSSYLGRRVTRAAVRQLTKTRTKNKLPSHKGHAKMILYWRPEFDEWYDKRVLDGARTLGEREPKEQTD